MINPFSQQHGIIMYSNGNNSHHQPVCCAVIPSSFGVPLVLTSWIALSLYFSSLSFIGKSPFYSYFDKAAIIVFGVLNIIFVVVCLFGYSLHLVKRSVGRYRQYAKLLACCVATIILDMFINFIVFCIKKDNFQAWCQNAAMNNLYQEISSEEVMTSVTEPTVVFNCSKLFNVEAEFSFACIVMMVMVYVYWASFIIKVSRNFVMMRPEIPIRQPQQHLRHHPSGSMQLPTQPSFQQPGPPIPVANQPINENSIVQEDPKNIVLSNIAPSKHNHQSIILL